MWNWEDVKYYYEEELKAISKIITPLFSEDIFSANEAWRKENPDCQTILKGMDDLIEDEEPDIMDKLLGRKKFEIEVFDIHKWEGNHPRAKIEHWIPIWKAWKHSYQVFLEAYKNNELLEL